MEPPDIESMLPVRSAMALLERLNLITPDIFDYFLMSLVAWYEEISTSEEGTPPNVFAIFEGGSIYSQLFIDMFIDGFARQYTAKHGWDAPTSPDFTDEQRLTLINMFMKNYDSMQPLMVEDFCQVLDAMQLVYTWDDTEHGGQTILYKHNPIVEVW